MDGNHHANRYFKNSDRHDLSLANGLGYLPLIEKYKEYLSGTSEDKEVRTVIFEMARLTILFTRKLFVITLLL